MTRASEQRNLTRRGYVQEAAKVWRPDVPPEDSAPSWQPDRPNLADWGVTVEQAREMLTRQVCPACGEGPWKSPLNHASRKHGIDRFTMRDICGLTVTESVVDPELSARFAANSLTRDMSTVNRKGKPRKKQRWTKAGRARNTETIRRENTKPEAAGRRAEALALAHTPEALARRKESMRKFWGGLSPEERAQRTAHLDKSPERMAAMREARQLKLQPCGTVASYKRGCRCDACREAKRASRR